MELRALAEQVLFGARWEDKLGGEDHLTDFEPGSVIVAPDAPGRPQGLGFQTRRVEFPKGPALATNSGRGRALHFFANHELLAAELMALALLRFPNAPSAFRLGVARTLREEQTHLGAYLRHMRGLGVELGEVPLNDFFWRWIAPMEHPRDYVVRLSLTFEQANLDFALHYATLFEPHDPQGAALLHQIHADEVRHVAHGAKWLKIWHPDTTDWEAWVRALPAPFTPNRAKGPVFDAQGRRDAGLSETFIRNLAISGSSKGRTPNIWTFNPSCEEEQRVPAYTPPAGVQALTADLAPLMAFLAPQGDQVEVPRIPSDSFLEALSKAGFRLPRLCNRAEGPCAELKPWGWSPPSIRRAESLGVPKGQMFPRTWAIQRFPELTGTPAARVMTDASEIEAYHAAHGGLLLLKAPWSASGRRRLRLDPGPLPSPALGWIRRVLREEGALVVEPWRRRLADFSLQLQVGRKDPLLGFSRFFTDEHGRYWGHWLGSAWDSLSRPEILAFAPDGKPQPFLQRLAETVAAALREDGYLGPAGIDLLLFQGSSGPEVRPLVEVNTRRTMGQVALALKAHLAPGHVALWMHLPIAAAPVLATLLEANPIQLEQQRFIRGVLATTDPTQAQAVLTILLVAPTRAECGALFEPLLHLLPQAVARDLRPLTHPIDS